MTKIIALFPSFKSICTISDEWITAVLQKRGSTS